MFPFKFLKPRMRLQYIDVQATVTWGVAAATATLWISQINPLFQQEKAPSRFDPSSNLPQQRPGGVEPESRSPELRRSLGTRKPADFRFDETQRQQAPSGFDPSSNLPQQRPGGVGPKSRSPEICSSLGTHKPADIRSDETEGKAPLGSDHAAAETEPPRNLLQQRPGGVGPGSRSPELRRSLGTGKPADFRVDETQQGQAPLSAEHEAAESAPTRDLSKQWFRGVGYEIRCFDLRRSLAFREPTDSTVDGTEMIDELSCNAKVASIESKIVQLKLELAERNEIRKSPKHCSSYEGQAPLGSDHAAAERAPPRDLSQQRPGGVGPGSRSPERRRSLGTDKPADFRSDETQQGRAPEHEATQSARPSDLSQQQLRGVGSGSRCHDLHKSLAFHKPADSGVDETEMIEELRRKAKIASIQSEIAKLKLELAERNEIKSPVVRRSYQEQPPLGYNSAATQSAPTGPVGPIDAHNVPKSPCQKLPRDLISSCEMMAMLIYPPKGCIWFSIRRLQSRSA